MRRILTAVALTGLPALTQAAGLNGAELSLWWAVPFAGILLSIALFPLLAPSFWHHHFGKVAVFWALCCAVPLFIYAGTSTATGAVAHAILGDYIPFLLFVGALFVVAGGIHVKGSFVGKPLVNAAFLLIGAFFAKFGTRSMMRSHTLLILCMLFQKDHSSLPHYSPIRYAYSASPHK